MKILFLGSITLIALILSITTLSLTPRTHTLIFSFPINHNKYPPEDIRELEEIVDEDLEKHKNGHVLSRNICSSCSK